MERSTLAAWLQREDEVLLYDPDGMEAVEAVALQMEDAAHSREGEYYQRVYAALVNEEMEQTVRRAALALDAECLRLLQGEPIRLPEE